MAPPPWLGSGPRETRLAIEAFGKSLQEVAVSLGRAQAREEMTASQLDGAEASNDTLREELKQSKRDVQEERIRRRGLEKLLAQAEADIEELKVENSTLATANSRLRKGKESASDSSSEEKEKEKARSRERQPAPEPYKQWDPARLMWYYTDAKGKSWWEAPSGPLQ